jgi:hypothetical protein
MGDRLCSEASSQSAANASIKNLKLISLFFGGHDNMVGKRISQEFSQLQHRHTLAMITDESMTHLKSMYHVSIVSLSNQESH